MTKHFFTIPSVRCAVLLAFALTIGVSHASQVLAKTENFINGSNSESVPQLIIEANSMYNRGRLEEGIEICRNLLARPSLNRKDKVKIYSTLSKLTCGMGKDYFNLSATYLDTIFQIGPCEIPLPEKQWQQQVRDVYANKAAKRNVLCLMDTDPDVHRIIISDFKGAIFGASLTKDFDAYLEGTRSFFEHAFANLSSFQVVERERFDAVCNELKLSDSGLVSDKTRLQTGNLYAAQYIIFGRVQFEPLKKPFKGKNTFRVWAVDVTTGLHVENADFEMTGSDVTKAYKELAIKLATALDSTFSKADANSIKNMGTDDSDAAQSYARGVMFANNYDYPQAYQNFKAAYDKDRSFTDAKEKMELYRPLAL